MADLNGDGRNDLISGSWPGEIYWFTRDEDGEWNEPRVLKTKGGDPVVVGSATAVAPIDWDRDGDTDLVVGEIDGRLHLVSNVGTETRPVFTEPVRLLADGEHAKVDDDAGPTFADWDGDGVADLICGDGQGAVWWFRAALTNDGYKLARGEKLIEGWTRDEQMELYRDPPTDPDGENLTRPGMRAKVAAADFNGDGLTDLLVGDFTMTYGAKPELSEDQIRERDRLQAESERLSSKMIEIYGEVEKKTLQRFKVESPVEFSEQQRAEYATVWKEMLESDEGYREFNERSSQIWEVLSDFERPSFYHGWVWVYLRKPIEDVAKPRAGVTLAEAAKAVALDAPTADHPITVGAALMSSQAHAGDEISVVVRARLAPRWHLYTSVPADLPYVVTTAMLNLPDGLKPISDWRRQAGRPDREDPRLRLQSGEFVMTCRLHVADDVVPGVFTISCRLDYQVCNDRLCLPPEDKIIELVLTVVEQNHD